MKEAPDEATVENGQSRLSERVQLPERAKVYVVVPGVEEATRFQIASPRLARPELTVDFVKEVTDGARFYTNGTFQEAPGTELTWSGATWNPATAATLDTGVLIVGPNRSGCLWVEDEDGRPAGRHGETSLPGSKCRVFPVGPWPGHGMGSSVRWFHGRSMFKRIKPLVIHGRVISEPLAVELAQFMTDDRALFVAELRVSKEYTWRSVAEECGRAWGKSWGDRQDVGAALCGLAAVYLGEDWSYLDSI